MLSSSTDIGRQLYLLASDLSIFGYQPAFLSRINQRLYRDVWNYSIMDLVKNDYSYVYLKKSATPEVLASLFQAAAVQNKGIQRRQRF